MRLLQYLPRYGKPQDTLPMMVVRSKYRGEVSLNETFQSDTITMTRI